MTRHLTSEELVAALDRTLERVPAAHLDACDVCRGSLADLEGAMRDVGPAGDVPEPSPLFWEHLSARVRAGTEAVPIRRPVAWWQPAAAFAAAAAVLLVVLFARTPAPVVDRGTADVITEDEATWTALGEMASTLSTDDVRLVVASAPESGGAVGELTPKEREAFVRLLGTEMGGMQ